MESTTRFTPLITILPTSTRTRGASAQCPSSWGKQGRDWARIATRNTAVCIIIIFLNVYCIYFVLTLEATEWGSPRNLSNAVTTLQEYFTFKILGITSVTSILLLAITPRIIITLEENTGNILPSQIGEKEEERSFGGWWNSKG